MKSETISIERGGRAIFARRWSPDGAPRACVQIAHGLAEHSARYEGLALASTNAGYVVTASDHRGHGPNCPPSDLGFFADANGWRECLDDLQAVARRIAADFPGLPLVFFGHSMGSFMGQTHIAEHGAELAGAVLSGTSSPARCFPARADRPRRCCRSAAESPASSVGGSARAARARSFGRCCSANSTNRSSPRGRRSIGFRVTRPRSTNTSPTPIAASPSRRNWRSTSSAGSAASPRRKPPRASPRRCRSTFSAALAIPSARSCKGLIDVYRAAGLTRVTTKTYPDARHETLNETNRHEVTADLVAWLDANVR
jgi:alpha-beta hydrolase superfamily lysophospholipase